MTRHRRGLTLVEVLVVLAILAVLAAILTPVLARARDAGKRTESVQKLRQLHAALQLYRTNAEGMDGVYDAPSAFYVLGLPGYDTWVNTYLGLTPSAFSSPCGNDPRIHRTAPSLFPGTINYVASFYESVRLGPGSNVPYHRYLQEYRQNAITFADPFCNPPGTDFSDRSARKRLLGVTLGGQLVNRVRTGDGFLLHTFSELPAGP